ncbi:lytic polysaccharide monooxygenase [Streptomyces hirsutus]
MSSGSYTFKYRVTAPHKGSFEVYITKPGYDPAQPLGWGDLDLANPVATATDPAAADGFYTFTGTLPERSGKQSLYAVWQRSDSPEAFYSCSDVAFGGEGGAGGAGGGASEGADDGGNESGAGDTPKDEAAPAPVASAPSEEQIDEGTDKSTIENHGHGDDDPHTTAQPTPAGDHTSGDTPGDGDGADDSADGADVAANQPKAAGTSGNLAETGGDGNTPYLMVGGAAALALGSAALFASTRRRAANGRHDR